MQWLAEGHAFTAFSAILC